MALHATLLVLHIKTHQKVNPANTEKASLVSPFCTTYDANAFAMSLKAFVRFSIAFSMSPRVLSSLYRSLLVMFKLTSMRVLR